VPNGAAIADLAFVPPSARKSLEILFVGLMSHPPNVVAARFLARAVMPRVWRDEPGARLVLCGRAPAREVEALAGPGVVVTGTVPSVAPYLTRAAVYANALFHGTGSSLKVPEALAAGVPLVSTVVGARGFPLRAGEHFTLAEDADGFARAIVRALRDRAALDARATAARAVAERFDWATIARTFARIVVAAAGGRGGGEPAAP
jgi:glycosyltransferase involved in cell wall biosynthesis